MDQKRFEEAKRKIIGVDRQRLGIGTLSEKTVHAIFKMMTDRMNKLCELIGIPLLDHIIVGGDNRAFFSFKEKGMIDNPRITLSTDYRNLDIKSPLVAEQGKAR